MTQERDRVVLYQASDGAVSLDVRLEDQTVWLTQKQMATLFATERSVITKHLRNVFATDELEEKSNVQKMHIALSDKPVKFYNLDIIISIGYRVNSKRGTQFRIWATNVLRDHVVRGYSVNERRLKELNQAIRLIGEVAQRKALSTDEATALLSVVKDYSYALDLLDDYDHERVTAGDTTVRPVTTVSYDEARRIIDRLRTQFNAGDIFGAEKDESLHGSLANIMQTFDGKELYPSLEEKAAQLLYSLVKNHSFVDGNKRIAAALFLWFLEKNAALYGADGSKRIADNALVAMTLLIAESRPEEKNVLTRVVVNLINRRNR
jgi:prophage maintenance system killer protein